MAGCEHCALGGGHALCVQRVPLFSTLSGEELAHVASLIRHDHFEKGEALYREGDLLDSLLIIHHGSAKAVRLTPDGREQILYLFSTGDFLGERNLFGGHAATCTVEALEAVQVCAFTREAFRTLLYAYPGISVKVIEELETRIARLEDAMQTIGVRSVDGRVGALLLGFAQKYGSATPEGTLIHLPLSREGLANYLGIARETVSRKLGQLEAEGAIRAVGSRGILLLNPAALAEAAGASS